MSKYCKLKLKDVYENQQGNYVIRKGIDGKGEIIIPKSDEKESYYELPYGVYICQFDGKKEYCSIDKFFTVDEKELGKYKSLDIPKIKLDGVEAEGKQTIFLFSDQLEEKFYNNDVSQGNLERFSDIGNFKELTFDTPAFRVDKNMNQFTTNNECWEFLKGKLGKENYYLYEYKFPVVIMTKEKLCGDDLINDLEVLKSSPKVNIMYQAQIHGNEYPAGEGALAIIEKFLEDQSVLNKLNIVILPCVNQLGNTQSTRDCGKININRDFLRCEVEETERLIDIFFCFLPELVIDAHTFTRRNSFIGESLKRAMYDVRVSGASTKNMDNQICRINNEIVEEVINISGRENLRAGYYSNSTNCNLGRVYYNLLGGCSILMESEGTRSGKFHFRRNVAAQVKGVLSIISYACRESNNIKRIVTENRKKFLDGSNINKEYVLNHVSSGTNDQKVTLPEYDAFGCCIDSRATLVYKRFDQVERMEKIPQQLVFEKVWFEKNKEDLFIKNHVCFQKEKDKVYVDMNQIAQFVIMELLKDTDAEL